MCRQRDAGGVGGGRRAERVQHVVAAGERQPHARLLARAIVQRERSDERAVLDAALRSPSARDVGRRLDAEAHDARPRVRHRLPQRRERVVGVDDGRAVGRSSAANISPSARATPARSPKPSRCSAPALVTSAIDGRASAASEAISPG